MPIIDLKLKNGEIKKISYPDDWSDDQAKDYIKKNFNKINDSVTKSGLETNKENKKGLEGIYSDIKSGIGNIPEAFANLVSNLPSEAYKSGKQILSNPARALQNLGGGVAEGLIGAANIPSNIASYLKSKDIGKGNIEDIISDLNIPNIDLNKYIGEEQEGDALLRQIGSFSPYSRIGNLSQGLKGIGKSALGSGVYGISQNENPITYAGSGALGEGLFRGLGKVLDKKNILPSTELSQEELISALNSARGTETGLGNIVENPLLKKFFENYLADIPFSGANSSMQRTANIIKNKGNEILDYLSEENKDKDIGSVLRDSLIKLEKETRKEKNDRFNLLNNEAEKEGITSGRKNLIEVAKNELENIEEDPLLASLNDKKIKKIISSILDNKGNKGNYSLKSTDLIRGKLGTAAQDAYAANDSNLGNFLRSLRDAALEDINSSIDESGNKNLNDLRNDAMNFYKQEWVPFEDNDITKFTRRQGDTDTLMQYFIKNSTLSDRGNLLDKLTSKLNEEEKKLLGYGYLSANSLDENKLNPSKLKTAFKNLGDKQKESLFDNETLNKLNEFSQLVKMNTEPLNLMFNPKTGARSSLPAIVSALSGTIAGALTGSLPIGLGAAAAQMILAKPLSKLLTNERFREKIVNSLINSRNKNNRFNISPELKYLLNSNINNNENNI